jgi:diguanylate cyclase (GGDEF)-like protein/PAS domain S-box-containing protein
MKSATHEQSVAKLINQFRTRTDALVVPMFLSDTAGKRLAANPAFCELLITSEESLLDFGWINFIHPEEQPAISFLLDQTRDLKEPIHWQRRYVNTQGDIIHVKVDSVLLNDENGEPIAHLATVLDKTESIESALRLKKREAILNAMTDAMGEGIVVQNISGEIILCNTAAEQILGLTAEQMIGKTSMDPNWRAIKEDGTPFPGNEHPAMITMATGERQTNVIMGVQTSLNAPQRWISINAAPIRDEDGKVTAAVATFTDITSHRELMAAIETYTLSISESQIELEIQRDELQQLNSRLKFLAETDSLTLLFNRGAILRRWDEICAIPEPEQFGCILLDIDHFKKINDTYGHPIGDKVLQLAATFIGDACPPNSAIGRYGGEEFLIVVSNASPQRLAEIAEKVRLSFESCHDGPTRFTASFGVAHSNASRHPVELIKIADDHLYKAKANGRNQVAS